MDRVAVVLSANQQPVTDGAALSLLPWGPTPRGAPASRMGRRGLTGPVPGVRVFADVDARQADYVTAGLLRTDPVDAVVAGIPLLAAEPGLWVGPTVVSMREGLAYTRCVEDGTLGVVGADEVRVTVGAARLVREITRRHLAAAGWVTVRGAAAVRDGHAVVVIGPAAVAGAAGVRLARQPGWELLAVDRFLARIEPDGRIMLVPWPAPVPIGMGLLTGLGLDEAVRSQLRGGLGLDPAQHPLVADALREGHRGPVRDQWGREIPVRLHLHQLADIAGVTVARDGYASSVLLPGPDVPASPVPPGPAGLLLSATLATVEADRNGRPSPAAGTSGWTGLAADDDESAYLDLLGVPRVGAEPHTATQVLLALADLPHTPRAALSGGLDGIGTGSPVMVPEGAPGLDGAGGVGVGAAGGGIPLPRRRPS